MVRRYTHLNKGYTEQIESNNRTRDLLARLHQRFKFGSYPLFRCVMSPVT
jgi:hypothetical protein